MKEWIICVVWIIMYEGVVHLGCVDHYVLEEWIIWVVLIITYEGMVHLCCVDHYVRRNGSF